MNHDKYDCCLYCGKIISFAGCSETLFCSIGCQFIIEDDGPMEQEKRVENYNESLIDFKKRIEKLSI